MILLLIEKGRKVSATLSAPAQYLVSYGVSGNVGCFVPIEASAPPYQRGMQILVRSERGLETGTVLCQGVALGLPESIPHTPGVILGPLSPEHVSEQARLKAIASERYREARELIKSLFVPMQIVDIEVLTDPATVIVHVLVFGLVDFVPLQKQLSNRWQMAVIFHNMTNAEALEDAVEAGCSSCGSGGGCGSGECGTGGGCATGGCHSHSSSHGQFEKDWKAYFAELRAGMERRQV